MRGWPEVMDDYRYFRASTVGQLGERKRVAVLRDDAVIGPDRRAAPAKAAEVSA